MSMFVVDSSFNPPTLAHMSLLLSTASHLALDTYLLLLSTRNADKSLSGASLEHRIAMMELCAKMYEMDMAVGITSYHLFVDKKRAVEQYLDKQRNNNNHNTASASDTNPQVPPITYFILGEDTVVRFFDPKYYHDMNDVMSE